MRNAPPPPNKLLSLNTWPHLMVQSEKIIELLGNGTLLEEVCHWAWDLRIYSMPIDIDVCSVEMRRDSQLPHPPTLLSQLRWTVFTLEL